MCLATTGKEAAAWEGLASHQQLRSESPGGTPVQQGAPFLLGTLPAQRQGFKP